MGLSGELISQFVKITKDDKKKDSGSIVNGTAVIYNGGTYVRLDGSGLLTPVSTTTDVVDGDRVTVMIKNHTATITGNISSPSARKTTVLELGEKIEAAEGYIVNLETENVQINEKLTANSASIKTLEADNVTINKKLSAAEASIDTLEASKLDADMASITYATIEGLNATNASIEELNAKKLDAESADIKYATIDFTNINQAAVEKIFSDSGIIRNLIVSEGKITGELVGVTIKGDLIEANSLKADKLVVLGENGLYYKLNVNALGETTASSDPKYQNGLDGSVIVAESITAEKISVDDLVAFNATIGGFNITENSLYSGVKSSATNTTRGIYLDNEGQLSIGDSSNYLRYYKDTDGSYKLEVCAENIRFGTGSKTVEETISDIQTEINTIKDKPLDGIEIGGRNLIIRSQSEKDKYYDATGELIDSTTSGSAAMTTFIAIEPNVKYTFSRKTGGGDYFRFNWYDENQTYISRKEITEIETGTAGSYTWTAPSTAYYLKVSYPWATESEAKLERGNVATDWSPAPEDVSDSIDGVANSIDSDIANIDNKIKDLNTNLYGGEESDGRLAEIEQSIGEQVGNLKTSTEESLSSLTDRVGSVEQSVSDVTPLISYIEFRTENGVKYMLIGNSGSPFKTKFTNEEIQFLNGDVKVAYISHDTLEITNANVQESLTFGDWKWAEESNGNLTLRYIG